MNIMQNLKTQKNNKRYDNTTKAFYILCYLTGEKKITEFISANFNGPTIRSI